MSDIQALRAAYEASLLELDGVVGVGTGVNDAGEAVLVVYTSRPPEEVAARLPQELNDLPCRFVFTGEVRAQGG